jgi:hypothetical protein
MSHFHTNEVSTYLPTGFLYPNLLHKQQQFDVSARLTPIIAISTYTFRIPTVLANIHITAFREIA